MDKAREKMIGSRLREFRKWLQIPRSQFAVSIGFGSERIASHESGRAPVRYEVFRAISQRYNLNPFWLATGAGPKTLLVSFNDAGFEGMVWHRDLFSEVFDSYIARDFEGAYGDISEHLESAAKALQICLDHLENEAIPASIRKKISLRLETPIRKTLKKLSRVSDFENHIESENKKSNLTNVAPSGNIADVKAQLPGLLIRLNQATIERGTKAALAKFMGVKLPTVSRWLSGEKEPGGENTLKLLRWVEQQERQK